MQLSGTENVHSMKSAIDGLMHQTEAIFVTDWMAGDVADAVNQVGFAYRDPDISVQAIVKRTGHNRNVVSIRISAPSPQMVKRIEVQAMRAAEAAIRRGAEEMRRTGFAKVEAAL